MDEWVETQGDDEFLSQLTFVLHFPPSYIVAEGVSH